MNVNISEHKSLGEEAKHVKKVVRTAGLYLQETGTKGESNIQVFEQIADNKFYYVWHSLNAPKEGSYGTIVKEEGITDSVSFITEYLKNGDYTPLPKTNWPLVEKPLPYNSIDELWQNIKNYIHDHLDLFDPRLYDVLTAWIFASYLPEVWRVVPYIFFHGPVSTGKTRGLEVFQQLCYRGMLSANITTAALFRSVDVYKPTVLLDETEIYTKEGKDEILHLLNSGYRKGGRVIRVRSTSEGMFLEDFDVFGFKAVAGTYNLKQTLVSRCIPAQMLKNKREVNLFMDEEKATELRAQLLTWRFKVLTFYPELSELSEHFLEVVGGLRVGDGRLTEIVHPLIAVTDGSKEAKENILSYAQKIADIRENEEKSGVEADIIQIIINGGISKENNVVLTSDLTNALNSGRDKNDLFKRGFVGWVMKRLGFEKRHTYRGNGWYCDEEKLAYLSKIYLIEDTTSGKGSDSSDSSGLQQPSNKECPLCFKPIYDPQIDTIEFEEKLCHKGCVDRHKNSLHYWGHSY